MAVVDLTNPCVRGAIIIGGIGLVALLVWCFVTSRNSKMEKVSLLLVLLAIGLHLCFTGRVWWNTQTPSGLRLMDFPLHNATIEIVANLIAIVCILAAVILFAIDISRKKKTNDIRQGNLHKLN